MRSVNGFVLLLLALPVAAQRIPDVHCELEDYPVKTVVAWQFPQAFSKLQVVVLRDPSGEQEARFDLLHGASLISLRYRGSAVGSESCRTAQILFEVAGTAGACRR